MAEIFCSGEMAHPEQSPNGSCLAVTIRADLML
jgi:hypothetical protein